MKNDLTVQEFISKFDDYTRSSTGDSVVIYPNLPYHHIELTETFVQKLKKDLEVKIAMAHHGMDKLDPTTRFAIIILEQSW